MYITNVDKLWKYPLGSRVSIKGKGYIYIGREDWSEAELFDLSEGITVGIEDIVEDEESLTLEILVGDYDIDTLVKIEVGRLLNLVNDGWALDTKMLNLTPELDKVKALRAIINASR